MLTHIAGTQEAPSPDDLFAWMHGANGRTGNRISSARSYKKEKLKQTKNEL
jgi:hypothetical protein